MTRVQAGKQQHELLPLRAGSEGSCSSSVSSYVRRRPVCWRLTLLAYYYWAEPALVPMRQWVLQGGSRAVGWDCRRASEQSIREAAGLWHRADSSWSVAYGTFCHGEPQQHSTTTVAHMRRLRERAAKSVVGERRRVGVREHTRCL